MGIYRSIMFISGAVLFYSFHIPWDGTIYLNILNLEHRNQMIFWSNRWSVLVVPAAINNMPLEVVRKCFFGLITFIWIIHSTQTIIRGVKHRLKSIFARSYSVDHSVFAASFHIHSAFDNVNRFVFFLLLIRFITISIFFALLLELDHTLNTLSATHRCIDTM